MEHLLGPGPLGGLPGQELGVERLLGLGPLEGLDGRGLGVVQVELLELEVAHLLCAAPCLRR